RRRVLLPAPFGPRSASTSPCRTASETSWSTSRPSRVTESPAAESAGSVMRAPTHHAVQEEEEDRRADERGDHAEGDLGARGHETNADVAEEDERAPGDGRGGHETPMQRADEGAEHVGDHQAHE